MASKKKSRASRKTRKQKANRAELRGLPTAAPGAEEPVAASGVRPRTGRPSGGDEDGRWPTGVRVALGVAIALAIVFGLSELRKKEVAKANPGLPAASQ